MRVSGIWGGYCTTAEIRFLAVDNKVIYQCKRRFFVGICIEKGLGLLWASKRNGRVPNHFLYFLLLLVV